MELPSPGLLLFMLSGQLAVTMRAMRYTAFATALFVLGPSCRSTEETNGSLEVSQLATDVSGGLTVGDLAPNADLSLQNGKVVNLSELKGRAVVLYFYPKDDTPGCRVEAQGFRDLHADFVAANTVVFGVSTQDESSHQAFIQKENLPFDLVIDREGKLASTFGVRMRGSVISRQTVLIDSQGKVAAKWVDVTPNTHAAEVLVAAKMSSKPQ